MEGNQETFFEFRKGLSLRPTTTSNFFKAITEWSVLALTLLLNTRTDSHLLPSLPVSPHLSCLLPRHSLSTLTRFNRGNHNLNYHLKTCTTFKRTLTVSFVLLVSLKIHVGGMQHRIRLVSFPKIILKPPFQIGTSSCAVWVI